MMVGIMLAFAVSIIIVVGAVLAERRRRSEFEERFPPISDDEFLARCGPGTNPEVALRVRKIVSHQMGVEYERIYPSTRFVEDLGAD